MWGAPAEQVAKETGVEIAVASIGFGQDYGDALFRWHEVRGVEEKGAVLVRPDRTVAWRAKKPLGSEEETKEKLGVVMKSVLGI